MQVDYFGADGGKLAIAFASGCAGTFAFMMMIGGFIWRLVGRTRKDRIRELEKQLDDDRDRCRNMETRLVDRIQQLETLLIFETAGNIRQGTQLAIAEIRREVEERVREATQGKDGSLQ
jgi:hypothetical protein